MNFKFLIKTGILLLSISYGVFGSSSYLSSKLTNHITLPTAQNLIINKNEFLQDNEFNPLLLNGFHVNNTPSSHAVSVTSKSGSLFWLQHNTKIMFDSSSSMVEKTIFQFNNPVSNFQIIYSKALNLITWIGLINSTWTLQTYNINENKIINYQLPNVNVGFGRITYDQRGQLWISNQSASQSKLYLWQHPGQNSNYKLINITWPVSINTGNAWDYRIQNFNSQTVFWFIFPAVDGKNAIARAILTPLDQLNCLQSIHFLYTPPVQMMYPELDWSSYQLNNHLLIFNPLTGAAYFNLTYEGQKMTTTVEATVDFGALSSVKQPWCDFSNPAAVGLYNKQFYVVDMISNTIAYNNGIDNNWQACNFNDVGLPSPTDGYNCNFSNQNNTITCLVTNSNVMTRNSAAGLYNVDNKHLVSGAQIDFIYTRAINQNIANNNDYIAKSDNQNNWWIQTDNGIFRMFNDLASALKSVLKISTTTSLPYSWINNNIFTSGGSIKFSIAKYNHASHPGDDFSLTVKNITARGGQFAKLLANNWTGQVKLMANMNNAVKVTFDVTNTNQTVIPITLTLATIAAEPDIALSNDDSSKIERYVGVVPSHLKDITIPQVCDFVYATEAVNLKMNFGFVDHSWLQMHGSYEMLNHDWKPIAGTKHIIPQNGVWLSGDKNNDFYKITVANQEQQPHVIYMQISAQQQFVSNFWDTKTGIYFTDLAQNKKLSIATLKKMDALQLNQVINKANKQHWFLPYHHVPLPPNPNPHHAINSLIGAMSIIFGSIVGALVVGAAICFLYPRLKLKFLVYKRNRN